MEKEWLAVVATRKDRCYLATIRNIVVAVRHRRHCHYDGSIRKYITKEKSDEDKIETNIWRIFHRVFNWYGRWWIGVILWRVMWPYLQQRFTRRLPRISLNNSSSFTATLFEINEIHSIYTITTLLEYFVLLYCDIVSVEFSYWSCSIVIIPITIFLSTTSSLKWYLYIHIIR